MRKRFEVKDKVLCYEPDKTKARVLYDATVVQVRDDDPRHMEYLIHFKNWNNGHDRWVDDSMVLTLSPENKRKQEALLAELLKTSSSRNLRAIPGISSSQKLIEKEREERETRKLSRAAQSKKPSYEEDDDEDSNDDEREEEPTESTRDKPQDDEGYVMIPLDPKLVHHLEEDFILISKKNKILKLPAELNVVQILENFVRHFAANMSVVPNVTRAEPFIQEGNSEMIQSQYTLELAMEVVDDLRILFDHMLPLILLYGPEVQQYKRLTENATVNQHHESTGIMNNVKSENDTKVLAIEENPKKKAKTADGQLLDYNRKYLIRDGDLKKTGMVSNEDGTRRSSRSSTVIQSKGSRGIQHAEPMKPPGKVKTSQSEKRITRKRKLSQDCCIDLSPKVFVRRTSLHQIQQSKRTGQSTPDLKEEIEVKLEHEEKKENDDVLEPSKFADANGVRRAVSLSNIWKWRMLPAEYRPTVVPPSLIYGPQHLLRLFVKLPEILGRMKRLRDDEARLNRLQKFFQDLLNFLVTYERDLFTELAYEKISDIHT